MTQESRGSRLEPVQVPINRCLGCGMLLDAVVALSNTAEPDVQAGDLTICVSCFSIGVVQEDGTHRLATVEECAGVPYWIRKRIGDAYRQSGQKPA